MRIRLPFAPSQSRSTAPTGIVAALVLTFACVIVAPGSANADVPRLPPRFSDQLILPNLGHPMDLAFTPDGRMLIALKAGRLRVMADGVLLSSPAIDLTDQLCSNHDRGLLGVA